MAEGKTVILECRASGSPKPNISWAKNDLPLHQDPRFQIDVNGSLRVVNLQLNDRGIYRCSASNSAGAVSEFARLEVYGTNYKL